MCNLCTNYIQLFDGFISICCPAWNSLGMVPLEGKTFKEVWNSPKIQKAISSNEMCFTSCPYYNKVGTVTGKPGITRVMVSFDETCNLKCQTCRTKILKSDPEVLQKRFKELEEDFKDLEDIEISGSGDPIASPVTRRWLQSLTREKFPKLKTITIQTNGLLFTEKFYRSLPEFVRERLKKVIVSIDAVNKETYEKIRIGGDWGKLQKNLKFLSTLNLGRVFCFVVQRDNYLQIEEFCKMAESYHARAYYEQVAWWQSRVSKEEFDRQNIFADSNPEVRRELRRQLKAVQRKSMLQLDIPESLDKPKFLI